MSTPAVPVHIVVPTPAHSSAAPILSYAHDVPLPAGTLVRVPLGAREVLGITWDEPQGAGSQPRQLRCVGTVLEGLAPLPAPWRRLVAFTARYYQRSLGEVALSALPPSLRELTADQLARRLRRVPPGTPAPDADPAASSETIVLSAEQQGAAAEMDAHSGPFLLFGSTGSGKTEVYLHAVQAALTRDPGAQALVLVPEINLTPQLEARFRERFEALWGASAIVSLHSAMTPAQRLRSWLAAHTGQARIVLGTRMAILASLPRLVLIVVDEEHDASYKQQEGARYSARDLAVWRARDVGARVILGSA
ncbi:MAG: DEAD/DEAH box helicase, partial [Comamonas sp.]